MKISPFTFQTEFGLAPDHSVSATPPTPHARPPTPSTVPQSEHAPPERDLHPTGASPLAMVAGTHGDMTEGREGSGCTPAVIPC